MSHALNLEEQVKQAAEYCLQNRVSQREIAEALELYARLDDYYAEIQEICMVKGVFDPPSIVVKVNGEAVKFQTIDEIAEWISDGLE